MKFQKLVQGLWLLLVTYVLSGCVSASAQEPLKVLLYLPGNPPYAMLDGDKTQGVFADIFKRLHEISGLSFKLVSYPVARGLAEFDAGRVDIEPGVNPAWRSHMKIPGQYSISYAKSAEVIVFATGHKKSVKNPADLFGDVVGIVRGFSYPRFDTAFSSGMIIRLDNLSSDLLVEQLLIGRLQQIFIGYNTILYLQKIKPEYRSLEIGDVVDEQPVMMRIHPDKQQHLPAINQALEHMSARGEIMQIYARYHFNAEAQ